MRAREGAGLRPPPVFRGGPLCYYVDHGFHKFHAFLLLERVSNFMDGTLRVVRHTFVPILSALLSP